MDLSVVIVNYNVKYFLEQCLHSVLRACRGIDAEIWVVDNHSSDGSLDYLPSLFPTVHFKSNTENLGFATANNSVIPFLSGRFILFLNPDTIVPEDAFASCMNYFSANTDCGALGVRMIDGSGKFLPESKRLFPTPIRSFFKLSGMSRFFPASKIFSSYYANNISENDSGAVEILSGAFMMLRKEVLAATGGFDQDFFMYGEDIDLSYRIRRAGYANHYFGKCTILHFKGESTDRSDLAYINNFYSSMESFVRKHYKGIGAPLLLAGIWLNKQFARLKSKSAGMGDLTLTNKPLRLIVCATTDGRKQLIELLNNAKIDFSIIKEADPSVSSLYRITADDSSSCILLQEGALSFKAIIDFIQKNPTRLAVLISANGSKSIVGGDDKNRRGMVIAG